jgi:hypothetical protein
LNQVVAASLAQLKRFKKWKADEVFHPLLWSLVKRLMGIQTPKSRQSMFQNWRH